MSMNNTRINLYKNPSYIDLIPLGRFSVNEPGLLVHPVSTDNISNLQYNHSMDKVFVFRNDEFIESKYLYFNNDWELNIENDKNVPMDQYPILSLMIYPSSIYKVQNVSFENNQNISIVHDLYTFNLHDLTGIFKDCKNLTFYKAKKFGPAKCIDERDLILDYAFANCFSLLHPPYHDINITFWEEVVEKNKQVYMNFMFMNTPNINYTHLFLRLPFIVSNNGGNGIFLNSALSSMPVLDLSNVTELRNTFSKTTLIGGGNLNYTTDLKSALVTDAMFKDSTAILTVTTNNGSKIKIANGMFKDSSVTSHYNPNMNLSECGGMYSGCTNLLRVPTLNLSNCEYITDVFRECNSLNRFYNIHPENATIVSGVYEGCHCLDYLYKVAVSTSDVSLNLTNARIINNLFKDCIGLTNSRGYKDYGDPIINILANENVYADSLFSGCSSLQGRIPLSSNSNIISSACMFKDCVNLNENIVDFCCNSENTSGMYCGCSSLTSYHESSSNSILSSSKFENCINLNEGTFYTNNATHTANMFKNCYKMTNFSGGSAKCNKSEDVSSMFEGCTNITSTPSLFDSSSAETLVNTFKGCTGLTNVNINLNKAKNADGIVHGCTSLSTINLTIDSGTNFTRFPNLDFRGTNLSITSFSDIVNKLPDMSVYTSNDTIISSNLTWTNIDANSLKVAVTTSDVEETGFNAKYSSTFTLNPGEYTITIAASDTNDGAYIEKYDSVNGNHVQMSPLVYAMKQELTMNVLIDEATTYRIVTVSTLSTDVIPVEINWVAPYFILDIRNTPADDVSSSTVVNGITTLNNKGWQVRYSETAATMSLFDDEIEPEVVVDNYLSNISIINEDATTIQTLDLYDVEDELYENEIGDIYYTDYIEIPAGYFNLSNKFNLYDKLIVYKSTELGEYPIAIGNENEFSVCFETFETSIIRVKFRNKNGYNGDEVFSNYNLVLKKL